MKAFGHSYGLCLPAACELDHFESALNDLVGATDNNTILKISKDFCQREEIAISWEAIDFVTM